MTDTRGQMPESPEFRLLSVSLRAIELTPAPATMRHVTSRTPLGSSCCSFRTRWHLPSEFLNRVVHGVRGFDHRHVPCFGNDPCPRILHQTFYSIHPRSSHAHWKRYPLQ